MKSAILCQFAFTMIVLSASGAQGAQLFWTDHNDNSIHRANLDGTGHQIIVGGQSNLSGIGIDPVAGKVYWTDYTSIRRADLDGSNFETVVNTRYAYDVAIDNAGGNIFWTNNYLDGDLWSVYRANLDGSSASYFANSDDSSHGIVASPSQRQLYWGVEFSGLSGELRRTSMDGSSVTVRSLFEGSPTWIDIDENTGTLYWAATFADKILKSDLSGNVQAVLVNQVTGLGGIAVDSAAGKLYWSTSHSIFRSNLDGSQTETVLSGLAGVEDIALYFAPVPEPSTVVLAVSGLAGLVAAACSKNTGKRRRSAGWR